MHYGPLSSVPTLSSFMLILLSLLLFTVAFKLSKKKHMKAGKMFVAILGVSALLSGLGGIKLISNVTAEMGPTSLDNSGFIPLRLGFNEFINDVLTTPQRIIKIDVPSAGAICGDLVGRRAEKPQNLARNRSPICQVGLVLNVGERCEIDCGIPK